MFIGSGTFGDVYKVNIQGKYYAMKRYRQIDDGVPASFIREANVMSKLKHPNIIELKEVVVENGTYYTILELATSDLHDYMTSVRRGKNEFGLRNELSRKETLDIFRQILYGVIALHANGFIHSDLKPRNILVVDKVVKISDLDCYLIENLGKEVLISANYRSPEVFDAKKSYTEKIDIWSLGCILYELFEGEFLFPYYTDLDIFLRITDGSYIKRIEKTRRIPFEVQSVLLRMVSKDPKDRPTAMEIYNELFDCNTLGTLESEVDYKNYNISDEEVKYLATTFGKPYIKNTLENLKKLNTYKNYTDRMFDLSMRLLSKYCYMKDIDKNQVIIIGLSCMKIISNLYTCDPFEISDMYSVLDKEYTHSNLNRIIEDTQNDILLFFNYSI